MSMRCKFGSFRGSRVAGVLAVEDSFRATFSNGSLKKETSCRLQVNNSGKVVAIGNFANASERYEIFCIEPDLLEVEQDLRFKVSDVGVFTANDRDNYHKFVKQTLEIAMLRTSETTKEEKYRQLAATFLEEVCGMDSAWVEEHMKHSKYFTSEDIKLAALTYRGKRYVPPQGWFRLKFENERTSVAEAGAWDYAYHGTKTKFVKSIVENGLVVPGNKTMDGTLVEIQAGHIPGQNFIFTSPSFLYSSHFIYATPVKFNFADESGNERLYYGRVMFQVRQKKTLRIQGQTLARSLWPNEIPFDNAFENAELEWVSNNSKDIVPYGLLIHVSEKPIDELFKEHLETQKLEDIDRIASMPKKEVAASAMVGMSKNAILNRAAEIKDRNKKLQDKEIAKKILWVDDEPKNNKWALDKVRRLNVTVDEALDTDTAMSMLQKDLNNYFIIITDMRRFEKRNGDSKVIEYREAGLDFLVKAREFMMEKGVFVPVLVYSSYARCHPHIVRKAYNCGCASVVIYDDIKAFLQALEDCPKRKGIETTNVDTKTCVIAKVTEDYSYKGIDMSVGEEIVLVTRETSGFYGATKGRLTVVIPATHVEIDNATEPPKKNPTKPSSPVGSPSRPTRILSAPKGSPPVPEGIPPPPKRIPPAPKRSPPAPEGIPPPPPRGSPPVPKGIPPRPLRSSGGTSPSGPSSPHRFTGSAPGAAKKPRWRRHSIAVSRKLPPRPMTGRTLPKPPGTPGPRFRAGLGRPKTAAFVKRGLKELATVSKLADYKAGIAHSSSTPPKTVIGLFYTYDELTNPVAPPGVDLSKREYYLTDEDFERVFGMTKADFEALPTWKRKRLKKSARLF